MEPDGRRSQIATPAQPVYSPAARRFHWWTVALIAVQVPVGLYMAYRGNTMEVWDALTNNLYSLHKLSGLAILVLVLIRLTYRIVNGATPDEPTIEPWQKAAAHVSHWSLYGLLIVVPLVGWLGVSQFGSLELFGLFKIPGLVPVNEDAAKFTLSIHKWLAYLTVALVGLHVAAVLFHYLIRKDGVLARMLPSLRRR